MCFALSKKEHKKKQKTKIKKNAVTFSAPISPCHSHFSASLAYVYESSILVADCVLFKENAWQKIAI